MDSVQIPGFVLDEQTGTYFRADEHHPVVARLTVNKQKWANQSYVRQVTRATVRRSKRNLVQSLREREVAGVSDESLLANLNHKSIASLRLLCSANLLVSYGPKRIVHVRGKQSHLSVTQANSDRYHCHLAFRMQPDRKLIRLVSQHNLFDGAIRNSEFSYFSPVLEWRGEPLLVMNAGGFHPSRRYWYLKTYYLALDRGLEQRKCYFHKSDDFGRSTSALASQSLAKGSHLLRECAQWNFALVDSCLRHMVYCHDRPSLKAIDLRVEERAESLSAQAAIAAFNNLKVRYCVFRNRPDGDTVFTTRLGNNLIRDIRFLRNEWQFVASGDDSFLRTFDIRMMREASDGRVRAVVDYEGHRSTYHHNQINLDYDRNLLVVSGSDNVTRFWHMDTGQLLDAFFDASMEYSVEDYPVQSFYSSAFSYCPQVTADILLLLLADQVYVYSSNFPPNYEVLSHKPVPE